MASRQDEVIINSIRKKADKRLNYSLNADRIPTMFESNVFKFNKINGF